MIRSRDFLLYVLALLFIVMGIGFTIVSDLRSDLVAPEEVNFSTKTPNEYGVLIAGEIDDREAYITALKAKIADGEGDVEGLPPVFSSVDDVPDEVDLIDNAPISDRAPLLCAQQVDHSNVITTWPRTGVTLAAVEGARVVSHTETREVAFGTSSATTSTFVTKLVQLPVTVTPNAEQTCISGSVVGIAADGSLIKNTDIARFTNTWPGSLVGYALDGFPIYAARFDETNLDRCGGLAFAGGYGYYLRENEDFVLGCFAGTPASL